jgi:hypothetical protein
VRLRLIGLLSLVGLLLAPTNARAGRRSICVAEETAIDCPSLDSVKSAIDRRAHVEVTACEADTSSAVSVTLRASSEGFDLELRSPTVPPASRTIKSKSRDCEALADTVALIVAAWLVELPWHTDAPPVSEPPPTRSSSAAPPREVEPASGEPAPGPRVVGPIGEPSEPPPIHLGLELLGGAIAPLDGSRAVLGIGTGGLIVSFGDRLEAGLRGSFEKGLTIAVQPTGAIHTSRSTASLLGRVSVFGADKSGPALLAGISLDVLSASGVGFSSDRSQTVVVPELLVGAAFNLRVSERVRLFSELSARIALIEDAFQINNIGRIGSAPRLWATIGAGARLQIF